MAENNGVLIETISKQAFDDMNKLIELLNKQITLVNTLTKDFKELKLPSQVSKAQKETSNAIKETSKAVSDYSKQLKVLENAQKRQMQAGSSLGKQIAKRRFETQQLNKANKEEAILTSRLSTEYQKQQVKLTQLSRKYADLALKKQLNGKLSKQEESLLKRTKAALDKKDRALKKVDAQMGKNNRNVGNYKSGLSRLAGSLKTLVAGFGVFSALQITREIFNQVKALDSLNKALLKVVDTQASLVETQMFLENLADRAGTDLLVLTKAYTKFFASAKVTNLTLEDTRKIFANTALAGASLALSTDDINGAMRALEQMLSKGNVQAEEIRGQLGERLPGAFQILARSMGLTTQELNKQLELGNVLAEEVLPKFADELAKTFGIDNQTRIDTLVGAQNRLSNAWTLFIKNIEGDKGVLSSFFKGFINLLAGVVTAFDNVSIASDGFFSWVDNMVALMSPGGAAIVAMKAQVVKTKELADAMSGLGDESKKTAKKIGGLRAIIQGSIEDFQNQIKELTTLQTQTSKTNAEFQIFQDKIDNLNVTVDLLTGNLEDLESGFKDLKDLDFDEVFPEDEKIGDFGFVDIEEMELLYDEMVKLGFIIEETDSKMSKLSNTWSQYSSLALDAISTISQMQKSAFDKSISQLDTEMQIQLQFAGDSAAAKEEIEERFLEKKQQLQEKQFKREQNMAILAININAANAIIRQFAENKFPVAIAFGAAITAMTVAQIAMVKSQQVPAFEKGTMNSPEGMALVNEKRNEVIVSPGGNVFRPQGRNQLVNLEKGSKVFKSERDFDNELGGLLGGMGINSYGIGATSPTINVQGNSLTKEDVRDAFKDALKGRANNVTSIDKNGFSTYATTQLTKRNILNNRVTFKGKNV